MTDHIPQPPTSKSRKRPCGKQTGRRRDVQATKGDGGQVPKQRKLNRYYLDPKSMRVVPLYPGTAIPEGARLVEQPADFPAPSIAAFFDAVLLPEAATLTTYFATNPTKLDASLAERFSRLSSLAGVGRQRRSTNLDVLSRTADPDQALRAAIVALAGADALDMMLKDLQPGFGDVDSVQRAVVCGVGAGNRASGDVVGVVETLEVSPHLRQHLSGLQGLVQSVTDLGDGSRMTVVCKHHGEAAGIADTLRAAGARSVSIKNFKEVAADGPRQRGVSVKADFNAQGVEVAAARAATSPKLVYEVNADGVLNARYQTRLFNLEVNSVSFRPPVTTQGRRLLAQHLLESRDGESVEDRRVREELGDLAFIAAQVFAAQRNDIDTSDMVGGLCELIGESTSLDEARQRLLGKSIENLVSPEVMARYRGRVSRLPIPGMSEDDWPVLIHEKGAARARMPVLHLNDKRVATMPSSVPGADGDVAVVAEQIEFVEVRGRTQVRIREVPVETLQRRQAAFVERKGAAPALVAELRDRVVADAVLQMAADMSTNGRPAGAAHIKAHRDHVAPYLSNNGSLLLLVSRLAQDPAVGDVGVEWSKWCDGELRNRRDRFFRSWNTTKDLDDTQRGERRSVINREFESDFWAGVPARERRSGGDILIGAATSMLAARLGRNVSADEVHQLAGELASSLRDLAPKVQHRGRALFAAASDGVVALD